MKNGVALSVVTALMLVLPVPARAAQGRPLPPGVAALAEVANPDDYGRKVEDLVRQLSPGADLGSLPEMLTALAKTEDPSSLDTGAPVRWLLLEGEPVRQPVLVFGLTDAERYLDSLAPHIRGREVQGGVHLYDEAPVGAVDEGVWEAGKARPLAIAISDGRAVLGRSVEAVRKVVALVEAGNLGSEPFFEGADAGGAARLGRLLGMLAEQGQNPFDTMRDGLAGMVMMSPQPTSAEAFQSLAGVMVARMEEIAGQVRQVGATVSLTPEAIVCTLQGGARADSGLAAFLRAVPRQDNELLRLIPAGVPSAFAMEVGDLTPLMDFGADVLSALVPPDASVGLDFSQVAAGIREAGQHLDGRYVTAVLTSDDGPLTVLKIAGVKQGVDVDSLLETFAKLVAASETFQQQAGVPMRSSTTLRAGAHEHAGHRIAEWVYDFEFVSPEGAPPNMQMVVNMQQAMVEEMLGSDFNAYSAVRDHAFITTQGAGALELLKELLDGTATPVTEDPRFAAAMAGMPARPALVGYVDLGELMGAYVRIAGRAMMSAGMPMLSFLAQMRFDPAPAVAFAAAVDEDGAVELRLVIPVQAVTSLVAGAQSAIVPMMMTAPPGAMQ